MLVSDIQTRVRRQFGDESGVQVTDADIIRWINDGMRQIVTANEGLLEKVTSTNLVQGQQEYTLPTDLLILKLVAIKLVGETGYSNLKGMSFIDFNQRTDGWDGNTTSLARPEIFTVFAGAVRLYPIPDADTTNGLRLYYNRKPVEVSIAGDTPEIPEMYHEAIVKYCMSQAYELDEDYEAAQMKANEINSDLALLRGRDDWNVQSAYPVITVMPWDD